MTTALKTRIDKSLTQMADEKRLTEAITKYEKMSGFVALNWRGLRKSASWEVRLAAAAADLKWFENHAQETVRELQSAVNVGLANMDDKDTY